MCVFKWVKNLIPICRHVILYHIQEMLFNEYECGEIYVITCIPTGLKYVGKTLCYYLTERDGYIKNGTIGRWKAHYQEAERNDKTQCTKGCRVLNNAIIKYGRDAFKVEPYLTCYEKDLNDIEKQFISEFNTRAPHGMNIGKGGRHHDDTKRLISIGNTGKVRTDEMKRHMKEVKTKYKGLPEYIYAYNDTNRGIEGYRVLKHPTLPSKKFMAASLTMEEKLQQAIEYVNTGVKPKVKSSLTRDDDWYEKCKESRALSLTLPKYISVYNDYNKGIHGFIVRNHPILKNKCFTNKKLTRDENLENAKKYIEYSDNTNQTCDKE